VRHRARPGKHGWRRDRRGMAGAVVTVLFVIIFTTMLAGVALYYVPMWSKESESEHMNKVSNEFYTIRDGVNDQVSKGVTGSSLYSHVALTSGTTTSFLGIQGEPSRGTLALDIDSSIFELYDQDNASDIYGIGKGMLYFQSHNGYYVNQEYSYEQGAVLVRQGTSSTVREGAPPVLDRDAQGCLTLTVSLFSLFGEATSVTGTGSAGVETSIIHTEATMIPFPSAKNITLNGSTSHGDGWARWINSSLRSTDPAENITSGNYTIVMDSDGFRFTAIGVRMLTIKFTVIEVKVSK